MKIYIVGPVASGKSTLAKKLSETLSISYHSLDEVIHYPDKSNPWGNSKRESGEVDKLFQSVIQEQSWIIEDVGRPCFEQGFKEADKIVLLEVPTRIRNYRIIKRLIKQRLGIEKCIYNPGYRMLKSMFKWSKNYDTGKDKLKERVGKYKHKVITLKSDRDIRGFLESSLSGVGKE
ncbi:AAA family ATPase [Clostridium sp.]|uniref:AAA family ATPase n=1 Tax=Clostridium sp. TaxID=1506 RepID=UPI002FCB0BF1